MRRALFPPRVHVELGKKHPCAQTFRGRTRRSAVEDPPGGKWRYAPLTTTPACRDS
jgi:hypothetical protein